MRYATAAAAAILVLACSCRSIQRDRMVETAAPEAFRELDSAELGLVAVEADMQAAAGLSGENRDRVRTELAALEAAGKRTIVDKGYEARRRALIGRAKFIGGDLSGAKAELTRSLQAKKTDELAVVLASMLAPSDAGALAALDSAPESEEGNRRIKAERGYRLLSLGRAREALAAFDDALPFLPAEYARKYGGYRDRAVALRDAPTPSAAPETTRLAAGSVSLAEFCSVTQENTTLLDGITGGRRWETAVLFDRLKAAGYFAGPEPLASAQATRADAALFLWNVLAAYRGNRSMLARYTNKYASRPNAASPVDDVAIGSPYFDAVLGCVELEIMRLADGRNFMPGLPIDGAGFFAALSEADRRK
ncbi:MAG: hypothetical protein NT080_02440 [Spirochaetes bacterium]|nr:hypothetical protein [Spirochaetota bacterium]